MGSPPPPSSPAIEAAPPHTSDPSNKVNWSQIVRGEGETSSPKVADATKKHQKKPPPMPQESVCMTTAETLAEPERNQVSESSSHSLPSVPCLPDGSASKPSSGEGKPAGPEDGGRVSKAAWRKPVANAGEASPPGAVMGAVSWPDLAEARNIKASSLEVRKWLESGKESPKSPASSSERQNIVAQGTSVGASTLKGADQVTSQSSSAKKQSQSRDSVPPDQSMKRNGHMGSKGFQAHSQTDNCRIYNNRGDALGLYPNNSGKWRNYVRDQGRGTQGWRYHGRGYGNGRDFGLPLHEQRIGPRNMQHPPPPPYMNIYPGFYNTQNFPYTNGGAYFMPAPPDVIHNAQYFGPPVPPGGYMQGPDPMTLRMMILHQIEYYFSVDNLCKDIYLRSNMDEQGFVPVSLIANFNRVRNLTLNQSLILDALQLSSVVEVQGDKLRKRDDWRQWLVLRPSKTSTNPSSVLEENHMGGNGPLQEPAPDQTRPQRAESVEYSDHSSTSVAPRSTEEPISDADDMKGTKETKEMDNVVTKVNSALLLEGRSGEDQYPQATRPQECEASSTDVPYAFQAATFSGRVEEETVLPSRPVNSEMRFKGNYGTTSFHVLSSNGGNVPELKVANLTSIPFQAGKEQEMQYSSHIDFLLKSNENEETVSKEVDGTDVQRLVTVTHAQLGSFIAVP